MSSLHCLVKLEPWKAQLASTAERGVDRVERCWSSCCPSFQLFSGSKPTSQRLFPLTQFTFHVRFIHRLVHPSPLGNAPAHSSFLPVLPRSLQCSVLFHWTAKRSWVRSLGLDFCFQIFEKNTLTSTFHCQSIRHHFCSGLYP